MGGMSPIEEKAGMAAFAYSPRSGTKSFGDSKEPFSKGSLAGSGAAPRPPEALKAQ
jgi:hypothetical protein